MSKNYDSEANKLLGNLKDVILPIDVNAIAKNLGVKVVTQPLPDQVSGILYTKNEEGSKTAMIIVNKGHVPNRRRFTIAHELGHYILGHTKDTHVDTSLRFRNKKSSEGSDQHEIEANKFAASLLMPKQVIEEEFDLLFSQSDLSEDELLQQLARKFKVSIASMGFRLANLELYHI